MNLIQSEGRSRKAFVSEIDVGNVIQLTVRGLNSFEGLSDLKF